MNKLSFKLDEFEGPLDLLLQLVIKHKLNINDIEIIVLVEQYLNYINTLAEHDYELAGDFLEMAARLVYIKVVSLLPQHEEAEILKKELEGKLVDYARCKIAAGILSRNFCGFDIFVRKPINIPIDNTYQLFHDAMLLKDAYCGMSVKKKDKPVSVQNFDKIVNQKMYSVTVKVVSILRRLYKDGNLEIDSVFNNIKDRSERVAAFLAVLELTKAGRIYLSDDNRRIYYNREKTRGKR